MAGAKRLFGEAGEKRVGHSGRSRDLGGPKVCRGERRGGDRAAGLQQAAGDAEKGCGPVAGQGAVGRAGGEMQPCARW